MGSRCKAIVVDSNSMLFYAKVMRLLEIVEVKNEN